MLTHTEQHERLLDGVYARADVALAHGRAAEGRDALVATLREVGLELDGELPVGGDTALIALVMSVPVEGGVSVYVVPAELVSPALRAALERCHGASLDSDAELERPDVFAAYQELSTATSAEPLQSHHALDPHTGRLQAQRFHGRLTRAYFVHEWL